ncbi:MAG: hypothetical protein K0Q58_1193 [Microbacterium sp.]|nr:hypothetical protein [Microbacterium sp.]
MPSPMTWPDEVVGTYCLALLTAKLATELMAVSLMSRIASEPFRNTLSMWCDWSYSTAVLRHACCSLIQFWKSAGTTG